MNRMFKIVPGALLGVVLATGLTGCSEHVVGPDLKAVYYQDSSTKGPVFKKCIDYGDKVIGDGTTAYYPTTPRYWWQEGDQTTKPANADKTAMQVSDKDHLLLDADIKATFTLNTSCDPVTVEGKEYPGGVLQVYHEKYGKTRGIRFTLNADDGTSAYNQAWVDHLEQYIGGTEQTLLQQAITTGKYGYRKLQNNYPLYQTLDKEIEAKMEDAVNAQMETDLPFFVDFQIDIRDIRPGGDLAKQLEQYREDQEKADAELNRRKAQGDAVAEVSKQLNELTKSLNGDGKSAAQVYYMLQGGDPYKAPYVPGAGQ